MNEVRYIEKEDLKNLRKFFKYKKSVVMLNVLNIGVNVGLRISDLLRLKFEDISTDNIIYIKEKKTGKMRVIQLNNTCIKAVSDLQKFYKEKGYKNYKKGYLFKSQRPQIRVHLLDVPITDSGVRKHLKEAKEYLNIEYPLATHSFRKTWGYNVYQATKDIGLIMKALNHSSEDVTLRYIGIEQEKLNETYKSIEI